MIRENNIKNRAIAVFLVISMLVTSLFNSLIAMAFSETSTYEDNVGCTATFNTYWPYFPVSDDSKNLSWDQEFQLFSEDLEEGFKVVIIDYFISDNEETSCLWYKVEAAPGYVLPEKLVQYPWVFQNYLGENADPNDSLIIIKEIAEDSIAIYDANGNKVDSLDMPQFSKPEITAECTLGESAQYQWQIEYEPGKWIDIYGENEKTIKLSFGMVGPLLGDNNTVNIRCKTSDEFNVVYSDPIPVTLTIDQYQEPDIEVSDSFTTSNGETVKVSVAGIIPKDATIQLSETDSSGIAVGSDKTVAIALDISIKNADGSEWQPASGETVTVTLEASQIGLRNGEQVVVYHLHEGTVKVLGSFEVTNGTISFDVDGFSKFVFAVAPDDNYDEMLGMYAAFNAWNEWTGEGTFDYFWLKSDPISDTEERYTWSVYDKDFEIDQVVKIKDYFIDTERNLWFQVEPVNDLELPATLKDRPWVYLNNLNEYDSEYDTLFFFEPEDLSEEDITVLDKYGLSVWELYIYSDEKREITVQTNLSGDVQYRWEVCYDPENLSWAEIEGQTSPTLNLSFGMLSGVLQDGEWAALRCVAYNATESVTSNAIIARVILTENLTRSGQQLIVVSTAPEAFAFSRAAAPLMLAKSATPLADDNRVVVTLTAQKEDRTIIWQEPYELEYNSTVSRDVEIPRLKGYDLYDANGNILALNADKNAYIYTVNETNVTEDKEIILTYKPGKTNYKVTYYLQNVLDEQYTQYGDPVVLEGITGEMVDVSNAAFSKTFDGFYQLLFETAEIASDGSTNIEIYYDRLYYKMLFDLDGGYGVQPVYARYETPVSVDNPTKAGYIFVGWDSNKGWTEDFITGEVTEWDLDKDTAADIEQFINVEIPAYHTSYTAIWRVNDSSKVTVVVWGQNADDDGYSYVSEETFEIHANTGSTITYVPGQNMCGFDEHTHGANCSIDCGKDWHIHSITNNCYDLICGKTEHTEHADSCWDCGGIRNHTGGCYSSSDGTISLEPETDAARLLQLGALNAANYGVFYTINNSSYSYYYYYKIGNAFYRVTDFGWSLDPNSTITLRNNCGHTDLHTDHDNSCAMVCAYHAHSEDCYKLTCETAEHNHSASCYSCGKKVHTHDAGCRHTTSYDNNKLWDLNEEKTGSVTVAADGSTVYNVYYDRTLFTFKFRVGNNQVHEFSAKWGSYIVDKWTFTGSNGTTYSPANKDSWAANSGTYTQRIFLLITMPAENATFTRQSGNSSSNMFYYYVESLVQEPGENKRFFDGKYYDYKFELENDFKMLYYDEDFFEFKGFDKYKSARENGTEYPLSNSGTSPIDNLYFYYTRNTTQLVFRNYETNTRIESVLYQAPLSTYGSYTLDASSAPYVYQEGSVTFKGWYLSPQVPGNFNFENEVPFDFTEATMPEGDLILYAWWQPVNHKVTFYHSYGDLEANKVYTVEDITYDYDVPHGSIIKSPYIPPADPTNGKYKFDGWFYKNDKGIETLWDFENSTVTSDVKIYAKWTSNTLMPYTVKFVYKDKNNNEIEIADPVTGSALAGDTKTFEAKVGSALKTEYQTRYFPEIQSHSLVIDIDDETKNVYTFYYVYRETVPYTVYYLTKENPNNKLGTTTYNGETYYLIAETKKVEENDKAIVTENAALISGYVFDAYQKRLYIDPNESSKNILYFIYEKDNVNGQFIVHYMTEKVDGSGFDEHSSFTGKMSTGSFYSVPNPPQKIKHFTWAQGYNNGTNIEKMSGTVTAGEVLELWVYYTRNEYPYKVQYLDQVTQQPVSPEKNDTAKWESQVTEKYVEVENYELVNEPSYTIAISDDSSKNIITFYYKENEVTINYEVVGPEGCGTVSPESESIRLSSNSAGGSTANPSSSIYKFVGWYSEKECTTLLFSDAKFIPKKGEKWAPATYYAKFELALTSLTIKKDGAEEIDTNQSFIFIVKGEDDATKEISLTVVVHGNNQVTIKDLPVGKYTVEEISNWSWRYKPTNESYTVDLKPDSDPLPITNDRKNIFWLDGNDWCDNQFGKKETNAAEEVEADA